MREIKFRAWDDHDKVMFNLTDRLFFNMYGVAKLPFYTPSGITAHAVLMQYTGRKDKNGVEIYESDIVEWKSIHNTKGIAHIDTVQWADGYWNLHPWIHELSSAECKILGNIYEHPELLKD